MPRGISQVWNSVLPLAFGGTSVGNIPTGMSSLLPSLSLSFFPFPLLYNCDLLDCVEMSLGVSQDKEGGILVRQAYPCIHRISPWQA